MKLQRNGVRAVAAAGAAVLLLARPAPASARVTVSVEFVFGGVAVGGIGIFVALSGTWETFAALEGIPDALVEFRGTRPRLGIPFALPQPLPGDDQTGRPPTGGPLFNLVRWRF